MNAWRGSYLTPNVASGQMMYPSLGCGPCIGGGSSIKKASPTLQRVPENKVFVIKDPKDGDHPKRYLTQDSSSTKVDTLPRTADKGEDWNNLQRCVTGLFRKNDSVLKPGELNTLHQNIRKLLESKTGPFFYDYFKQELLTKGMIILREELKVYSGHLLLEKLQMTWNQVYTKILPTLEAIMYPVKTKRAQAIRLITLIVFRDSVVLKIGLDVWLDSSVGIEFPGLKQMLLVLQNLNDTYPPNKNKMNFEGLVAKVISPFLGFKGLYENGISEPSVVSSEPSMVDRKKSCEIALGRRISRPFSVQPKQLENLNDLFLKAIRKQQVSSFVR